MSNLFIQLGRFGDILNILPFLHAEFKASGERPRLMVASEFASLLDGVSYVEPVIFDGPPHDILKAFEQVKATCDKPIVTQVNGPRDAVMPITYGAMPGTATSFQKESWRLAGKLNLWDDMLPLVIDRRDKEREQNMVRSLGLIKKGHKPKLILVSLSGISSPFPHKEKLMAELKQFGPAYRVLELPQTHHIYDLLGLYERAHCLIADDSAPLHLAWACRKLPVFALANDNPSLWHGCSWRPNHVWYCRYSDFENRMAEMRPIITSLKNRMEDSSLIHVWSEYQEKRPDTSPAIGSPLPVYIGACGRDSAMLLKDEKRVPYVKDVIRMAMQKAAGDGTTILLTRPTTIVEPHEITANPPGFAYRVAEAAVGTEYRPVGDLFYATKSPWKEMLDEIPDVFLSNDYQWSQIMWAIFRKRGAKDVTGAALHPKTEPKTVKDSLTTAHNTKLCSDFMVKSGIHARYPRVSEQLECLPLDLSKLKPFGYNPCVLDLDNGVSMFYRFHDKEKSTKVSQAWLTKSCVITDDAPMHLEGKSTEDPKAFKTDNGNVIPTWVESNFPDMPMKSVVKLLHENKVIQPNLPGNDWSGMQKNWVPFWHLDRIYFIYQCHPTHRVYQLEEGRANDVHETPAPRWPYGEIRGGTPPIEYEGLWLRFFHSRLWNEIGPVKFRYFIGAYLMSKFPPFEIERVSKKPILYGSEVGLNKGDMKVFHAKPNVVFPGGCIKRDDHFVLSVGVNDSACALVKVFPKDFHL